MENKELPKIKGYCKDCIFAKRVGRGAWTGKIKCWYYGYKQMKDPNNRRDDLDYCSHFEPKEGKK